MIRPDDLKWWELPLRCLFGFHRFRQHPGLSKWRVCSLCWGEKEVR